MQKDVSAVQKGHRLSFCLPHRNTQTQQSKNGKKKNSCKSSAHTSDNPARAPCSSFLPLKRTHTCSHTPKGSPDKERGQHRGERATEKGEWGNKKYTLD